MRAIVLVCVAFVLANAKETCDAESTSSLLQHHVTVQKMESSDNCIDDTVPATSVQGDFYAFSGLQEPYPEQFDDCPIACDATTFSSSIYLSVLGGSDCTQWPGAAGKNSMNEGVCNSDGSFTWDQYAGNCDCGQASGREPVRKTLYQDRCIVDTAKGSYGICGKIVDYTACAETAAPTPAPQGRKGKKKGKK